MQRNLGFNRAGAGIVASALACLPLASASAEPVVTNLLTSVHARVTDPVHIDFGPDGSLYVGRDAGGSGGSSAAAVKIHRVGPGGAPVEEYGDLAIPDPDAVVVDRTGVFSGVPGTVIVGGVFSGNQGKVWRIVPGGAVTELFAASSQYGNPSGFTLDDSGRLLFTDAATGSVFRSSGGAPSKLFGASVPVFVAVDRAGQIVVSHSSGTKLSLYSSAGALINGSFAVARNNTPVVRGPGGGWTTDIHAVTPGGALFRISPTGESVVLGSGFDDVSGLAFGPDGALYAAVFNEDLVYRIGLPSVPGAAVSVHARVTDPVRLSAAPDGTLFVGRDNTGSGGDYDDAVKVHRIPPGGGEAVEYGNAAITDPDVVLYDAAGVATGLPGALLVGGVQLNQTVGKLVIIRPDGSLATLFGPTASSFNPSAFVLERSGSVVLTDTGGGTVWRMTNGAMTLLFRLPGALHMAVDELDRLVVGTETGAVLRVYTAAGAVVSESFATVAVAAPLASAPGGFWGRGICTVDDRGRLVTLDTNGVATVRGTGFPIPYGLCFGPDEALYFSDFTGDRVWRVVPNDAVPRLSARRVDAGLVRVEWQTVAGQRYRLKTATTLPGNPWVDHGGVVAGDGTLASVPVAVGSEGARFFRLERVP